MEGVDHIKYQKKQKRFFIWTIAAVSFFIIAWTLGIYRHLFGFDPRWAGDNFVFNIFFLFPVTIVCLLICYFTGGLTIINWCRLPNKMISIFTIFLSLLLIGYVGYYFLILMRQH